MVRSLSFIQLFVILTVGYIGGVLLYRGIPEADFTTFVRMYDSRADSGETVSLVMQVISVLSFYVFAIILSLSKKSKMFVMLVGALKSALFGLSSAHILAGGVKMLAYAGWWFPFQLTASFLVLLCCWTLSPPFFAKTSVKRTNHLRLPIVIAGVGIVLFLVDKVVYNILGS